MLSNGNVRYSSRVIPLNRIFSSTLFWIVIFSVMTALSAQVAIPVQPVPFTLQTMFVLLSGAFLGSRAGAYSMLVYLGMGIIGIPVFAGFSAGIGKLFSFTGGYLLAFVPAAFLTGYIIEKRKTLLSVIFGMVLSTLLILLAGATYLSIFYNGDFQTAFNHGLLIFTPWDIIKISASVSIYYVISRKYPKLPAA